MDDRSFIAMHYFRHSLVEFICWACVNAFAIYSCATVS